MLVPPIGATDTQGVTQSGALGKESTDNAVTVERDKLRKTARATLQSVGPDCIIL